MRAVRFDGELSVEEVAQPVAGPGEALVRLRLGGICNTDLEITRGYMGFAGTLGHEFVGEVVGCEVPGWEGARVVGEINLACRQCERCRAGLGRHCAQRTVLGILGKDGAFADYLTLPLANLHRVPESIPDRQAVFVEPLAAALEILDQVSIGPGERVLIIGDGKLGLLIAQVLATTGCALVVSGRHRSKLALLDGLPLETRTPGDVDGLFDVAVEASGTPEGLHAALAVLRPRGTLVLKSTYAAELHWNPAQLVIDELTLVGSRCGRFEAAIEYLQQHPPRLEEMVTDTFALADAARAFERARSPGALKVLLEPDARG